MHAIAWSDDLNLGIEEIDRQHCQIVEFINRLTHARQHGDGHIVAEVLEGLIAYTLSHFAFEEALMEDAGYPLIRAHRAVHESFARRVQLYHDRLRAGDDITEELSALLYRWLFHHIKHDDASYAKAVHAKIHPMLDDRSEGSWLSRTLGRLFR